MMVAFKAHAPKACTAAHNRGAVNMSSTVLAACSLIESWSACCLNK